MSNEEYNLPPCPEALDPKQWAKLISLVGPEIVEEMAKMDPNGLQRVTAQSELNIREQEAAMRADGELTQAKMRVKDLADPYRDAIKAQRSKQRIASYLLGE
jgi:hypothetical protein